MVYQLLLVLLIPNLVYTSQLDSFMYCPYPLVTALSSTAVVYPNEETVTVVHKNINSSQFTKVVPKLLNETKRERERERGGDY